ncbi:MAG TPA: hypothetical protein VGQ78_09410 [Vicinamibacteria bacterium]|nr:hypothetical protein [Vicinamibacteria bacterium]
MRGIFPRDAVPWLPPVALAAVLIIAALAAAAIHRQQPVDALPWREPGALVLLAALGLLLGLLLSHRARITSDGIDHYAFLRSLAVDHDLDLANDYALLTGGPPPAERTPIGRTANVHPIGPALVWVPFYAVADIFSRLTGRPADGLNDLYKNAVAIGSVLYGWLGAWLLYRTAARRAGRAPALLAALGVVFGTFLLWYLAYAPTMAHAPAFAAAALFVWLWLRPEPVGLRRAALLGAACGLAALLRWPNALLALLPAISALPRLGRGESRPLMQEAAVFLAAAVLLFSPQMVVWKLLYGSWLTIPQGGGFLAGRPALAGVLFSPRHGLFAWSPLLYLGLGGLILFVVREPRHGLAAAAFLIALARVNAGVADWWGGSAFGGRRFDAALPLFGLGLALALRALARAARERPLAPVAALVALFVLWNLLLARQYRSGTWDYAGPVSFEEMGHGAVSQLDRFLGSPAALPASVLEWMRTGRRPADYESIFSERPYARWAVRMGLDDRMFLEDGWSAPSTLEGAPCRLIDGASAAVVVPLHGPRPARVGARLASPTRPTRVRVFWNDRPIGGWDVEGAWNDYELELPVEVQRAGRNLLRLRVPPTGATRPLGVAGLWVHPGEY